ncbi:hypothetical protein BDR26DRAFT_193655 [Obelidium mucronatum]|nr:hypothetical protein BDR26DRAFT_193655 [Obelidium mucronatum]
MSWQQRNEAFRKSLVKSLEDSKFKDKTTPTTNDLVTIFILNPFRDWPSDKPCAIIIDALDELWDHDNASSVLDAFQSLNKPVKLFLTSRPDVTVSIKGKKQFEIETFDVESDANKEDIRIFTHDRLAELTEDLLDVSSQDFEKIVNTLAEASKGLFIWITLVLGNVSGTEKFSATEDETLEAVEEILGEGEGTDVKETGKQLLERLEQSATLDLQSLYCRALFKAYPTSQLSGDFQNRF